MRKEGICRIMALSGGYHGVEESQSPIVFPGAGFQRGLHAIFRGGNFSTAESNASGFPIRFSLLQSVAKTRRLSLVGSIQDYGGARLGSRFTKNTPSCPGAGTPGTGIMYISCLAYDAHLSLSRL